MRIAIIGAGISAATLAFYLGKKKNFEVEIFEKSRGIGGRMSTRYSDNFSFDHGAQYFTARSDEFKHFLKPLIKRNIVSPWKGKFINIKNCEVFDRMHFEDHYVGTPKMNMLPKELIAKSGVKVNLSQHIKPINEDDMLNGKWHLKDLDSNKLGEYDFVISTAPCHQAAELLPKTFEEYYLIEKAKLSACYSLMLGFSEPLINIHWSAAKINDSPISWIAKNETKGGRNNSVTSILIQTTNGWAEENVEADQAEVKKILTDEFYKLVDVGNQIPEYENMHRWKYANVEASSEKDFLIDEKMSLAACGDWCISGKVESAFLSSYKLADYITNNY